MVVQRAAILFVCLVGESMRREGNACVAKGLSLLRASKVQRPILELPPVGALMTPPSVILDSFVAIFILRSALAVVVLDQRRLGRVDINVVVVQNRETEDRSGGYNISLHFD